MRKYLPGVLLGVLMVAYLAFSVWYTNQRHLAFETGAFDTGVYIQPLWNFIQGKGFAVSIIEDNGPLRWATHVEPVLFIIAPLYALWPDPRLLFWLQAGAMTMAAIPIFVLGWRRTGSQWVALVVALAYFLMPATQSVTLFDFHAVTMAPLFLLSAILFLEQALGRQGVSFWIWPVKHQHKPEAQPPDGQAAAIARMGNRLTMSYGLTALFFLLALSTKEDISLHIFMIGLYLLLLRRRWQEGLPLVIVGLVWFYVTFQVIIPAYRTGGGHSIYAAWFETLGNTPLEIALSPFSRPDKVMGLILRPDTFPALIMITAPLAFLPWAGLPLFALTAPSLAFVLLSQNPTLRQLETWHYAAPMLPFIMLGTIDGLARVSHFARRFSFFRGEPLYLFAVILLFTSLTYHYFRGYTPLSRLYEPITVTAHHRLGHQLARSIPPDASVLAQAQLVPYVAHREKLGIWSGPLLTDYDYIWLDLSHHKLPNRFDAHGDLLIGLIYEHGFGTIVAQDGYLLLQKGAARTPINDTLFTFTELDQLPANAQLLEATFGSEIKLLGVQPEIKRLATPETEPQILLYLEALTQPAQDYQLFLYQIDADGNIVGATDYPQPAMFWWPTSRWQTGDRRQVRINTIPWWTGDKASFSYAVGLSRSNDPWDVAARLPVTVPPDTPQSLQPIDSGTLLPVATFYRFGGLPYVAPINVK
jgi:uncharacterized membrane protein